MCLRKTRPGLAGAFRCLELKEDWSDVKIDLVLITPTPPCCRTLKCPDLLDSFCRVDFRAVAGYIKDTQSPLGVVLAEYLCKWAGEKAGTINPWIAEKV